MAHIKGWGATGIDTLENVICLCRKHHQEHEHGDIPDIALQMVLYHFYGYGPDLGVLARLDWTKELAQTYGLRSEFFWTQEGLSSGFHGEGLHVNFLIPFDMLVVASEDFFQKTINGWLYEKVR